MPASLAIDDRRRNLIRSSTKCRHRSRGLLFALAVLAYTGGAVSPSFSATWRLNRLEDRSSRKVRTYVELAERNGKPAVLFLGCKDDRILPGLRFPARVDFTN